MNVPPSHTYLQDAADAVVGSLGLEVGIEQERGRFLPPAVLVADTPDSNTGAVLKVQACLDCGLVVGSGCTSNVELSDGTFRGDGAQSLKSLGVVRDGPGTTQVRLRADTVDGHTSGNPLLNLGNHSLGLCVGRRVEVVVVDVQLRVRVDLAGSLEGSSDETLTQDIVEDRGAEATILSEDLVDNVLFDC